MLKQRGYSFGSPMLKRTAADGQKYHFLRALKKSGADSASIYVNYFRWNCEEKLFKTRNLIFIF